MSMTFLLFLGHKDNKMKYENKKYTLKTSYIYKRIHGEKYFKGLYF